METKSQIPSTPSTDSASVEAMRHRLALNQARDNQNPGMAMAGGAIAAIIGATVWAAISYLTEYQIGWMAVGVGFLVGWAVKTMGKGVDTGFGVIGAALALFGCALGNVLAICGVISGQENVPYFEVLSSLDVSIAFELLRETFSPIDLLFYGLALYYGFKYSRVTVEPAKASARPSQSL